MGRPAPASAGQRRPAPDRRSASATMTVSSIRQSAYGVPHRVACSPAVAICVPSGLNATASTALLWLRRTSSSRVAMSHTRAVLSRAAVAICVPSGLNATSYTLSWWSTQASSQRERRSISFGKSTPGFMLSRSLLARNMWATVNFHRLAVEPGDLPNGSEARPAVLEANSTARAPFTLERLLVALVSYVKSLRARKTLASRWCRCWMTEERGVELAVGAAMQSAAHVLLRHRLLRQPDGFDGLGAGLRTRGNGRSFPHES